MGVDGLGGLFIEIDKIVVEVFEGRRGVWREEGMGVVKVLGEFLVGKGKEVLKEGFSF